MNESLITGLVALTATAIGWVLGRADTWLKKSEDHKRARRYILSYLLDLHHLLSAMTFHLGGRFELFIHEIKRRLEPHYPAGQVQAEIDQITPQLWCALLKRMALPKIAALKQDYAKAVDELAYIEPIIAYRLRGQTDIMELVDAIATWAEENSRKTKVDLGQVDQLIQPVLLETTTAGLREHIELLAARSGRVVRNEARNVLAKHSTRVAPVLDEDDRAIIDRITTAIIAGKRRSF